jgi:arabinogalactan oligomer/maltooligosaccharide transport system permease protein
MKKVVIGLRLQYVPYALGASLLSVIALFLPLVTAEGKRVSIFSAALKSFSAASAPGESIILILAAVAAVVGLVLGLLSFLRPGKLTVRLWLCAAIVQTACFVILLFAGKGLVDGLGLISGGFMVRSFGLGYWIALLMSFVGLTLVMMTAKINVGYIVLTILSIIWLFPILWIFLTACRYEGGFYVGYFIPKRFTFQNFINLFSNSSVLPFGRWYINTLIVAGGGCLINTAIILSVAFILSRTRFKGRTTFMKILLVIGMFPGFMSMLAVYNILKGLGLNQSLLALIVVGAAGAAMGYHVTKGFFDTIPKALDEAAIIDGANRLQIFIHVTLPLSKSIIVYTVLGSFLGAWSDYIFPSMLFGDKQSSYTVAVGLFWLTDFRRIDRYYTQFAAGAVVVAVPIVVLFIFLQRFYVEGLSGSVKG